MLKRSMEELIAEFDRVGNTSDPEEEWRRIRLDGLPQEYSTVIKTARALLDGKAPGLFSGVLTGSSEIVFTATPLSNLSAVRSRRSLRK